MIKIWQGADQNERNLLSIIFGIIAVVAVFGVVGQIGYYAEFGRIPYSPLRYAAWATSLTAYLLAITHHMAHSEEVSRTQFLFNFFGTTLIGVLTIYLLPETPGWLLLAPMGGDMAPHLRWPYSLPLYLFLLCCMVLPLFGFPPRNLTLANFASAAFQMGAIIAFTAVFSGLQRQLADEKGKLEAANQKLAVYANEVEELATTKERNRLAREIHDNLGHYLTVVNVQLEAGKLLLERNPDKARAALEKAQRLTQEGLQAIRDSVSSLREGALNKPVSEAIAALIENERVSGVSADFHLLGTPAPLDPKTTLTLYRTAQEGLTNIRKHAQASQVDVTLDYRSAETVELTVQDDGNGSDQASGGFGLVGIQERINLLDGKLKIETAAGAGFKIYVSLPKNG
ncbi:MAG: sensor histidine kinase [Candidatus Promineifilaceae bacterium]